VWYLLGCDVCRVYGCEQGEEDVLNVMASRLLIARCKVYQYDFEAGYILLSECMNTAMARFGERSIAVVEALLAQAEYCFLQAIYPQTDTILIKALTILGKLRDAGMRSNLFKSVCGEVVYALCELYITTGMFDRVYVLVKEFDQVIDSSIGSEHPNHYYQLIIKGKILKFQGKFDLARQAFETVISIINQAGFKEHKFAIGCLQELAEIYYLTSCFKEALSTVDEAMSATFCFYANPDHIAFSGLKTIKGHVLLYQGK
jgi:tetratricopeptide (TPR) repeat protein